MKCIGYDENGKRFDCPNEAGTPWTPMWCSPCDERRKARITESLENILKTLEARKASE